MFNRLFDLKTLILFCQDQNRAVVFTSQAHKQETDYENSATRLMAQAQVEIALTMSDSMDYYVRNCEKVILPVKLAKNRHLGRHLKFSTPLNACTSGKKRWGKA